MNKRNVVKSLLLAQLFFGAATLSATTTTVVEKYWEIEEHDDVIRTIIVGMNNQIKIELDQVREVQISLVNLQTGTKSMYFFSEQHIQIPVKGSGEYLCVIDYGTGANEYTLHIE